MARSRTPAIMADSAHAILTRPSRECTGNFFLAEDVLVEEGVTSFDDYAAAPGAEPAPTSTSTRSTPRASAERPAPGSARRHGH